MVEASGGGDHFDIEPFFGNEVIYGDVSGIVRQCGFSPFASDCTNDSDAQTDHAASWYAYLIERVGLGNEALRRPGRCPGARNVNGGFSGMKKSSKSKGAPTQRSSAKVLRRLVREQSSEAQPAQFVRVEVYAIQGVAPKSKLGNAQKAKASILDIINEATRATEQGLLHLVNRGIEPLPPKCLYGHGVSGLFEWFREHTLRAAENSETRILKGKPYSVKQDVRRPTVLTEVTSWPGPPDEADPAYVAWKARCVQRLKKLYGDRLVSVLEHLDEGYGHLHAIVANKDAKPIKCDHPGHGPAKACEAEGGTPTERQAAMLAGLRAFQQQYHDTVGAASGLLRISPEPNARHSYREAQIRAAAQKELSAEVDQVIADRKNLEQIIAARVKLLTDERMNSMQVAFQRQQEKARRAEEERARQLDERQMRLDAAAAANDEIRNEADAARRKAVRFEAFMNAFARLVEERNGPNEVEVMLLRARAEVREAASRPRLI